MTGLEFIELESAASKAPWAGYDAESSVEKILMLVDATQSDPEAVLTYERANQNRKAVIEALTELTTPEKAVEIQA